MLAEDRAFGRGVSGEGRECQRLRDGADGAQGSGRDGAHAAETKRDPEERHSRFAGPA